MRSTKSSKHRTAAELEEIRVILTEMEADPRFNTKPSFRVNKERWPDNSIPFVEEHIQYLMNYKSLNPDHYISNLRLMLKKI